TAKICVYQCSSVDTVIRRPLVSGSSQIHTPAMKENAAPSHKPEANPNLVDSAPMRIGVRNCVALATFITVLSAVFRMRVGNSSENIGPKFDHVPVPIPVATSNNSKSNGK